MIKIDSPHNETFKKLLSLTTSKGLKKEGLFLLSGAKLVTEFLQRPNLPIHYEVIAPKSVARDDLAKDPAIKRLELSAELFAQLDILGTGSTILVLEQPDIAQISANDIAAYLPDGLELVLPVGDPGNLGALLRSCEAFGVPRVILTREAAHPFLPKTVKASAGSVLRLPLIYGPELADFPYTCLALDSDGINVDSFAWPDKALLIVGEEGPGLGDDENQTRSQNFRFITRIRIPTVGVESLNVVVAASIAIAWHAYKKRNAI